MIDCEGRKANNVAMTLYLGREAIKRLVPECEIVSPGKLHLTGKCMGTFEFDHVGIEIWGKLIINYLGGMHSVVDGMATVHQEVHLSFA